MKVIIFAILVGWVLEAIAQDGWQIDPRLTDRSIDLAKASHIVKTPARTNGFLMITIGGTGSQPAEFRNVHRWGQDLGYHVLAIDYPNAVISTLCQTSDVPRCYNGYREELVFGGDFSPLVTIDKENSIDQRIKKLLSFLIEHSYAGRWTNFMKNGQVQWDKIVLVGHSQGAGHVGYLGKRYAVNKVIMTGGPHDMDKTGPASWLTTPSATPANRFFSLLHWKDYFGYTIPLATSRLLMGNPNLTLVEIAGSIPRTTTGQIFISNLPFPDPHNSLALEAYKEAWLTLLGL